MNIKFQLNDDGDAIDMIGGIEILGDDGRKIADDCTVIDVWLGKIWLGLSAMSQQNTVVLDLVDEPEPISLVASGSGFQMSYGLQVLSFNNIDEAKDLVLNSARRLMAMVDSNTRKYLITHNAVFRLALGEPGAA